MRIERGVWQFGKFASCAGHSSGELSTVGAEVLPVVVAPAVAVFVAVDVGGDEDDPALLLPACEQAASNRIIAKKETIRRTACMYASRSSL